MEKHMQIKDNACDGLDAKFINENVPTLSMLLKDGIHWKAKYLSLVPNKKSASVKTESVSSFTESELLRFIEAEGLTPSKKGKPVPHLLWDSLNALINYTDMYKVRKQHSHLVPVSNSENHADGSSTILKKEMSPSISSPDEPNHFMSFAEALESANQIRINKKINKIVECLKNTDKELKNIAAGNDKQYLIYPTL